MLLEIEELAGAVGAPCTVEQSGCLGMCNRAPNAVVVKRRKGRQATSKDIVKEHTRISSTELSAAVVKTATGKEPPPAEGDPRRHATRTGQVGKARTDGDR